MNQSFEEAFEAVRWGDVARFMRETGWTYWDMAEPNAEDLQGVVRRMHREVASDEDTNWIRGGGWLLVRSKTEDGEDWMILFDIASTPSWRWPEEA